MDEVLPLLGCWYIGVPLLLSSGWVADEVLILLDGW